MKKIRLDALCPARLLLLLLIIYVFSNWKVSFRFSNVGTSSKCEAMATQTVGSVSDIVRVSCLCFVKAGRSICAML